VTGTVGSPGILVLPAISPDGATVVVDRGDPETAFSNLWLHDLARGAASRFTSDSGRYPVWSPDGSYIAFTSVVGKINQKSTSGVAQEEVLDKEGQAVRPLDWSRDGRYLIEGTLDSLSEIWVLPLFGDRKRFVYVKGDFATCAAKLSPNGKWLAYMATPSALLGSSTEVFVQPFPPTGAKYQISNGGGRTPRWSPDGKQLFYHEPSMNRFVAVDVQTDPAFSLGRAVTLPIEGTMHPLAQRNYDVTPDGREFLVVLPASTSTTDSRGVTPHIDMVLHWFEELKARVPVSQ